MLLDNPFFYSFATFALPSFLTNQKARLLFMFNHIPGQMTLLRRFNSSRSVALLQCALYHSSPSRCCQHPFSVSQLKHPDIFREKYEYMAHKKLIAYDPIQAQMIEYFDDLLRAINSYRGPQKLPVNDSAFSLSLHSLWSRIRSTKDGNSAQGKEISAFQKIEAPRGLYLYGGVGCGKTFMMDLFLECISIPQKRRVHFHKFMLGLHDRMHQLRQQEGKQKDGITCIADEILSDTWILCFDEFQVTDVADALMIQRLFSRLLVRGCIMIATSNRPPRELYKNGLQRELFLPFIDLLQDKCHVLSLAESTTDHRLIKSHRKEQDLYMYPLTHDNKASFQATFQQLAKNQKIESTTLQMHNRSIHIAEAICCAGVCKISFREFCEKPHGASDYLLIAKTFPIVFFEDIILLDLSRLNSVNLLDVSDCPRYITFCDSYVGLLPLWTACMTMEWRYVLLHY